MEIKLPSPCLLVLVGASSSGKSTWANEHFDTNEVVSSDALRAMVGIDENDQQASGAAFEILQRIISERLARRLTTVIDTTGLNHPNRSGWIAAAHEHQMPAHAVLFDTGPEECERRNDARPFPLPKSVLRKQLARFAATAKSIGDEGFDGVHESKPISVVPPQMVPSAKGSETKTVDSRHTFGLMVSRFDWAGDEFADRFSSVVRRAESAGFRDLWVMDHFRQIHQVGRQWEDIPEAYTALAFAAGITKTIRLGTLVTSVTHRNPALLGKMIATLDVISGGRAICGLGVGWDEAEHDGYGIEYPTLAKRYELIEETLEMLPLLWGKGSPDYHGRHIQAKALTCYPRPIQEAIPILIGGSGEKKTLLLVAKYADACNLFGNSENVSRKVHVLRKHCSEIGRDSTEIEVTHLASAVAASDRHALAKRVDELRDRNTGRDDYAARFNGGTVEDLVGLFESYDQAGATHSIVSLPDVALEGSIETFGSVIEAFE